MLEDLSAFRDAAIQASFLADALPGANKQPRVQYLNAIREQQDEMARRRDRLRVWGCPPLHLDSAKERELWWHDMNRALDKLLAAVREHVEAGRLAPHTPQPPDPYAPLPDEWREYHEAITAVLSDCVEAKKRQAEELERIRQLTDMIDRTRGAPSAEPPQSAADESTPKPPAVGSPETEGAADSKAVSAKTIEALLHDEDLEVLEIVQSIESADTKMRKICRIDRRFLGHDSEQWAGLLGVTGPAIRRTDFWRTERQKAIEAD
jgi:hypothetical protein